MVKLFSVVAVFCVMLFSFVCYQDANATSQNIVIFQIQVGAKTGEGAATQEFISIYNNSDHTVDVSNWCLSNKSVTFACFSPDAANISLTLPSHQYSTITSDSFTVQNAYLADVTFPTTNKSSGSIVAGSDTISLIDGNGTNEDTVSWTSSLSAGTVLQRQFIPQSTAVLLDTDNFSDFQKLSTLVIPNKGLEEWVNPDECINLEGAQVTVPDGYTTDGHGNCSPPPIDICTNIIGVQTTMPNGYGFSGDRNCIEDSCPNISGFQAMIPSGYVWSDDNGCVVDIKPLNITELLPNANGSDTGNEFIEIYNPNEMDVELSKYLLSVGADDSKYSFPSSLVIGAGQYTAFYNDSIKFTLVNTSSYVKLLSSDLQLIDDVPIYSSPADGESWSNIDGTWQYTNQPTPGGLNLASIEVQDDNIELTGGLEPCAANQYRNPATNRCRMIASANPTLTPCKTGQYRSEETNRCRNIADDAVSPKPCAANQERNLDTNRCRNIANNSIPGADYAPKQSSETSGNSVVLWSLISVVIVAVGYGIWEWRAEITKVIHKVALFFKRDK